MNKLKNIIFDFDGVIIDSYKKVVNIFQSFDSSITEVDMLNCFNTAIDTCDRRSWQQPEFFEYLFKEYPKKISSKDIYSDAISILQNLKADGYNLFLITSNKESVVNKILQEKDLMIFEKILGFETHTSKIKKFRILEKDFDISSDNSIFVTDTRADITEGHQAGYKVLAETFGYHNRERLEKGSPEWIVDSWDEIIQVIQGLK